jgi:hypothetical protein
MARLGMRRAWACAGLVAALIPALTASSALAVTVGQIAPGNVNEGDCSTDTFDLLNPTVASGTSYVVPSNGGVANWTVTAWSTNAKTNPGVLGLKVLRKVGEPNVYKAIAHEGPHQLAPGVNTFPAHLLVQAGDVVGAHIVGGECAFETGLGDPILFLQGVDLPDGQQAAFGTDIDFRVNVAADVIPTSDFTLGKAKSKPNGTAVVTLNLPNPGDLKVSGKGVKGSVSASSAKHVNAGKVKVVIRAKGKNKQKLAETGKVTVKPKFTFTPNGGSPHTEKKKVKLRRK